MSSTLPSQLVIAVGTYDGVLAGWEKQGSSLQLTFATPVHEGSLRSLCLAAGASLDEPGVLLSCGYDEVLRTHDWHKRLTSSGEVRTPADFGTPTCSSFAPPSTPGNDGITPSTHCIVGFGNGKLGLYKKRDWSIQHVLAGHEGGVASLAVHPTGKMALSGGQCDGKLKLWDLTKGRLAYVAKIPAISSNRQTGKSLFNPICSLVWSIDGNAYAWAHGNHVTVRDVATGKDLLDVDLPGRVNEITLMVGGSDHEYGGLFVAAACNDGSLPVLAVQDVDGEDETTRRAILAIEPVDNPVAGEERFKCIQCIRGFHVVTANSAGVVSIMNLEGAVRMIMSGTAGDEGGQDDVSDDDEYDDQEEELAVDILESVRLGTGARITALAVWSHDDSVNERKGDLDESNEGQVLDSKHEENGSKDMRGAKRKSNEVEIDEAAVEKARSLVSQAKKLKKRKDRKKHKRSMEKKKDHS